MKKNSLMKALSAVAVSAVALSAASMSAFAGDYTLKDGFDADASTAKPTLTSHNEVGHEMLSVSIPCLSAIICARS